jgi:signal peptidase II
MPDRRVGPLSWLIFWGIALAGCAFDLVTKHVVFSRMALGQVRTVLDDVLEIQPSRNTGALWGLGQGLPNSSLIFAALSIIAGVAIVWWLFVRGAAQDLKLCVALGLVMAGALGNCYDRLRFGYVRDFVHLHVDALKIDFAIFNFADNMLVLGALGLIVLAMRPNDEPAPGDAAVGEPGAGEPAGQTS